MTKRYPVVFILNAHQMDTFANAVATVERLSFERIPEMIVIGIGNTGRAADYFPIRPGTTLPGGAAAFQKFLEEEFLPRVDKAYRTQAFRVLAGQSNSGLFTPYSLASRPRVFNAYIAASHSLGWFPEFICDKFPALFKIERSLDASVHIDYGGLDYADLVNDNITSLIRIF